MKFSFTKIYNSVLSWLASGFRKKIAFLFSHGGLHCLVLIILLICAYLMYDAAMKENEIVLKDLNITWKVNKFIENNYDGGTRKYDIDFLRIDLSPMPRASILNNTENLTQSSDLNSDLTNVNLNKWDIGDFNDITQSLVTIVRPKNENDSISCKVELLTSKNNQLNKVYASSLGKNISENIAFYPSTGDYPKNNRTILANLYSSKSSKIYFRINPKFVDENDNIIQNPIFSNKSQPYSPKIEIIMGSHLIYSVSDKIGDEELRDPYMFNIISPTPDKIAQGKFFTFTDSTKLQHIFNHGIVVTAEEISQVDRSQKRMILFNVLIGTILAFCLEIIVQLIIKWRNLAIRKEQSK